MCGGFPVGEEDEYLLSLKETAAAPTGCSNNHFDPTAPLGARQLRTGLPEYSPYKWICFSKYKAVHPTVSVTWEINPDAGSMDFIVLT